jgi:hypothetical protein
MSYDTTADEKLREAREAVNLAISALSKIVVEECDGYDEYTEDFKMSIEVAFDDLRVVRRRIAK